MRKTVITTAPCTVNNVVKIKTPVTAVEHSLHFRLRPSIDGLAYPREQTAQILPS